MNILYNHPVMDKAKEKREKLWCTDLKKYEEKKRKERMNSFWTMRYDDILKR